ncbi:MAG: hypothetical protein M1823_000574 [Watsoniomyces obsoletus]|nr:MAG: hypothetical protein M1823_000574 [Watsoniomyces obsoletus]
MSRSEGGIEGNMNAPPAGSGRRKRDLLPTNATATDNGSICSTERVDGGLNAGAVVGMGSGPTPVVHHRSATTTTQTRYGPPVVTFPDHAPPVTARTLQQLELPRVINNAKLRHDINFDPHLHFRPNPDAMRGERKRREAEAYWAALGDDLEQCALLGDEELWETPVVPPRVQRVLAEIRDILRSLVPERDVSVIDDTLDLPLLVQQIRRASLDYQRLAGWLSGVLKTHCAPMRDAWVDDMQEEFERAARDDDRGALVEGIRTLFGILEAMKLDVANHQVRNLRTLLVEDTVNFERHLFRRRIEKGELDVRLARRWYERAQRDCASSGIEMNASGGMNNTQTNSNNNRTVATLVRAIVESLASSSSTRSSLPDTFEFDRDRIHALQWELQGMVALEVCMKRFELFVHEDLRRRGPIPARIIRDLRGALLLLMEDEHHDDEDEEGSGGEESQQQQQRSWNQQVDELALVMARAAHRLSSGSQHHHLRSWSEQHQQTVRRLEEHLQRDLAIGDNPHCVGGDNTSSGLWRHFEEKTLRKLSAGTISQTIVFLEG